MSAPLPTPASKPPARRRRLPLRLAVVLVACAAAPAPARTGSPGGSVTLEHRGDAVVTYRATLAGEQIVIEARHLSPWHTYAMDNLERARRASGKPEPETELPTRIEVSGALEVIGPWRQSPPADLSQPEIRWFTWGFSELALFAAPVERRSGERARVRISGQACTQSRCAQIDGLELELSVPEPLSSAPQSQLELGDLVGVESGPDARRGTPSR